jgi:hypothetical protein
MHLEHTKLAKYFRFLIKNALTAFQAHITNLSVRRIFPEVHGARKLHGYSETHIAH